VARVVSLIALFLAGILSAGPPAPPSGGPVLPPASHSAVASIAPGVAYSCGNVSANHCYGIEDWTGATDGVRTSISLRSTTGGDGFVTNETWLSQDRFWIEAGTIAVYSYNNGKPVYFWADMRPGDTQLNLHYGPPVAAGDFGHAAAVDIHRTSATTFSITVTAQTGTKINTSSTGNTMAPNEIQIGTELAGTNGAGDPHTNFADNQYKHLNGGGWYYQHSDGSTYVIPSPGPVATAWDSGHNPSNPASPPGGVFATCIHGTC